ncbi:hypothetical protein AB0D49_01185 [Streptomyces sp. NPDC048290]|uniref:hypothetical protein n=1 Tax=Streptomyces sp. NPDC048290 TaxID=3155811 RepID=UPI00343296D8
MDTEIHVISDDEGLLLIGDEAEIEHLLAPEKVPSKDLHLPQLKSLLGFGATVAQAASEVSAHSARWVRLTPESAHLYKKYGLRKSRKTGCSTGVLKGPKGQAKGFLEFAQSPRSFLSNPAVLANAAALMAQVAMQQAMGEITTYLVAIDKKVDDVLHAQKDAALANMIGVGLTIDEAMTIREQVGRVSEITWSKVQNAPTAIAVTQAYALSRLDRVADNLERETKVGDLATAVGGAAPAVQEWLAVLARCFQLHDAFAVLELDRVLDATPDELDNHRLGLRAVRRDRLDLISHSTERLLARMNTAVGTANAKVLLHPAKSPALVQSSNQIAAGVHDFHRHLGIESGRPSEEARRWLEAALEARDRALETGARGVDAARSLGSETLDRASSVKGRLAGEIAERTRRRRGKDEEDADKG